MIRVLIKATPRISLKATQSNFLSSARYSSTMSSMPRGAFILLEGVDRCGKSTQASLLVENLKNKHNLDVVGMRFPDRTTPIGKLLSAYLQNTQDMDDNALHLLFSANRWEAQKTIQTHLNNGTTVICDRYAYSGVAFTAAKGLDIRWCRAPDHGLPAPDTVLFLQLSPEAAAKRGGFGEERYEKPEFQKKVEHLYENELKDDRWVVIDADKTVEDLNAELCEIITKTAADVKEKPLEWPLQSISDPIIGAVCYIVVIFTLQYVMKYFNPVPTRWFTCVHNLFLCILSIVMLYGSVSSVYEAYTVSSAYDVFCDPQKQFVNSKIMFWTYIFYLSKYYEFLDTILLVLKKKNLEFLHWYHHSITVIVVYLGVWSDSTYTWIAVCLNTFVHTWMYMYYFLSTLNISVWWKKYLTVIQMLQFWLNIGGLFLWLLLSVMNGFRCAGNALSWLFCFFINFTFFLLFFVFYKKTYKKRTRKPSEKEP